MSRPAVDPAQRTAAPRRPIRKTYTAKHLGGIADVRPRVPVQGVGRFSRRHYDPVTGRKLEKTA